MNGEGINYKLPEGAILKTVQCQGHHKEERTGSPVLAYDPTRGLLPPTSEVRSEACESPKVKLASTVNRENSEYSRRRPSRRVPSSAISLARKWWQTRTMTIRSASGSKQRPPTFLDARDTTENGEGRFVQDGGEENNAEFDMMRGAKSAISRHCETSTRERRFWLIGTAMRRWISLCRQILVRRASKPKRKLIRPANVADAYEEERKEPEPSSRCVRCHRRRNKQCRDRLPRLAQLLHSLVRAQNRP